MLTFHGGFLATVCFLPMPTAAQKGEKSQPQREKSLGTFFKHGSHL